MFKVIPVYSKRFGFIGLYDRVNGQNFVNVPIIENMSCCVQGETTPSSKPKDRFTLIKKHMLIFEIDEDFWVVNHHDDLIAFNYFQNKRTIGNYHET
jgi:glucose dehydrogenase